MSDEVQIKIPETGTDVPENKTDGDESVSVKEEHVAGKLIDEMTSIEREIASMHEAEDDELDRAGESGIPGDDLDLEDSDNKLMLEMQAAAGGENDSEEIEPSANKQFEGRNGTSTVSELSDGNDSTGSPSTTKDSQLEHDDLLAVLKGEDDKEAAGVETGVTIEGEGEFQIVDIIDNDNEGPDADPLKETIKKEPLTKEEAHKLALEQYESLERPKSNRRRKQDIKAITQPADLLTSLVSDWSDGDENNADDSAAPVGIAKKKLVVQVKHISPPKSVQADKKTQESTPAVVRDKPATTSVTILPKKLVNSQAVSQPKKLINAAPTQEKKIPAIPPPSPFKRTRIIKRKIIWDPDAPETQFSYAKLVKPSTPTPVKKEAKKERATPVPKKKEEPKEAAPKPLPVTPTAKRQASETSTAVNGSKKKKFSEIDRLLGDEGAVNMLNSLEGDRTKRISESEPSKAAPNRKATASASPPERALTPQKKEVAQPKRRTPKPKASNTWDYVYKHQKQDEDSMIIRRRSNSSYSSSASINRLSVDGPSSATKTPKGMPKSSAKTPQAPQVVVTPPSGGKAQPAGNQFEFAKPESKNQPKKMKSPIILVNPLSSDMKRAAAKRSLRSPTIMTESQDDEEESEVTVLKIGSVRQVTFNTHRSKLSNTFTPQLLNELSRILEHLQDDSECNAVLLLSAGPNFCQGIDFTDLALGTLEKRKNAAVNMGQAVKNFLLTLAKFRKPLIAGVNGINSGLGVTMLPLFDVVIGSDKGTYETPYAKIGQIPEGYYIFSETSKIRSTFKTKLLWLSEKLHSTESALSGLVNKLTSVPKVNEEALACAKKIASLSAETYSVMKERSIEQTLPHIITSLEDEEEILVRQWCSAPCVENFKHFIHKGQW